MERVAVAAPHDAGAAVRTAVAMTGDELLDNHHGHVPAGERPRTGGTGQPRPDDHDGGGCTHIAEAIVGLMDAIRTYVDSHRDDLLADLDQWLRIPGISAQPDRHPDVARSAQWFADAARR